MDLADWGLSGAARAWGFNTVRLTTCPPGGCAGTGYDQTVNNNLDQIVSEYSAAHIVVMMALHQITPGPFPTAADLASITAMVDRRRSAPAGEHLEAMVVCHLIKNS